MHHIGIRRHDFCHRGPDTIDAPADDPAIFDPKVAPFRPAETAQALCQSRDAGLRFRIVLGEARHHANTTYPLTRLRSGCEWPPHHAAERCDEFTPSKENAHAASGSSRKARVNR